MWRLLRLGILAWLVYTFLFEHVHHWIFEDAYPALIADVTRTPEFSPEVSTCRWLDGAAGPAVGARFA